MPIDFTRTPTFADATRALIDLFDRGSHGLRFTDFHHHQYMRGALELLANLYGRGAVPENATTLAVLIGAPDPYRRAFSPVSEAGRADLRFALESARAAAEGDSNDAEIAAWQHVGDLLDQHLRKHPSTRYPQEAQA